MAPGRTVPPSCRVESLADPSPCPEEVAERNEEIASMRQKLATLKPDEREALGLFALGFSYREICTSPAGSIPR
ncbi:MAG TPA: hypothetical protein VHM66_06755 [Solirubrobacterales bacterium]|nr:hypothetical protein [Solirubrobacterales bacterium]